MAIDTNGMPISGNVLLAIGAFALASIVAGQLMGARMIEKAEWPQLCPAILKAEAPVPDRFERKTPTMHCDDTVSIFGAEARELCHIFGNPDLNGQTAKLEKEAYDRKQVLAEQRRAKIARHAGSRCDCAANTYLQDNWWQLGLYAGTARQVSLSSVTGMKAELRQTLVTPHCASLAEAVQ
ncbi:hypothetical protein [uncultured Roseobacter sp.]|uniref:hypothetical protein n=1 Tax=uncultured Roseobacter sp. TaxID=114847 RepID=UPI0026041716|nr:hypothetical protein [uncultured Roseobacter sp.]